MQLTSGTYVVHRKKYYRCLNKNNLDGKVKVYSVHGAGKPDMFARGQDLAKAKNYPFGSVSSVFLHNLFAAIDFPTADTFLSLGGE